VRDRPASYAARVSDSADLDQKFADAQARIKPVTGLGNDVMLDMYALYKQASVGDATGARPGMMDLRGRAKFDAWTGKKGMTKDAAKHAYIAVVDRLLKK
jgi:acyl-CoA-binding protein